MRMTCVMTIALAVAGATSFARPIRPLNGLCNTLPLKGDVNEKRLNIMKAYYRALQIPETRFHDVVAENAGIELVDVSRIFPLFHLDENDPRNYNFGPTDLYLQRARELGGRLEFRFGEQIEHQRVQFQVRPPADIEKWARICLQIARHYNSGWANGFHWNIDRFSVWEEPDNDRLLTDATKGNFEKCYFRMYASVARLIKAEWPSAHVGGPNTMGPGGAFSRFVKYCADEKLPLDFAAYTCYERDPWQFAARARQARKILDDAGFKKTELEVSEWHVGPLTWEFTDPRYRTSIIGPESPAYAAAVLTVMQDEPVDHLFFYAAHVGNWSLFDGMKPRPVYYAFRTFAELRHGERLEVPANPAKGVYALAAKTPDGGGLMLVAQLEAEGGEIGLGLPAGFRADEVRLILDEKEPQPVGGWRNEGGKLLIRTSAGSATFRVRLCAEVRGEDRHFNVHGCITECEKEKMTHTISPVFHKGVLYGFYQAGETHTVEAVWDPTELMRLSVLPWDRWTEKPRIVDAGVARQDFGSFVQTAEMPPCAQTMTIKDDVLYLFFRGRRAKNSPGLWCFRTYDTRTGHMSEGAEICTLDGKEFNGETARDAYNRLTGDNQVKCAVGDECNVRRFSDGRFYTAMSVGADCVGLVLCSENLRDWTSVMGTPDLRQGATWEYEIFELSQGTWMSAWRQEKLGGVWTATCDVATKKWSKPEKVANSIAVKPYFFSYRGMNCLAANLKGPVTTPGYGTAVRATLGIFRIFPDGKLALVRKIVNPTGCHYVSTVEDDEGNLYLCYSTDERKLDVTQCRSNIAFDRLEL